MLTFEQIIFRLILAIVFGGIIGWEREMKAKTAGLRTHVLLCLGSALAMLLAVFLVNSQQYGGVDITRVAAGVLQGIGLLCVAAVLRYKESVAGLSTSASLWTVAVVGLAVGAGFYSAAVLTTIFCLLILTILTGIEDRYIRKTWPQKFKIKFLNEPDVFKKILASIQESQGSIRFVEFQELTINNKSTIELVMEAAGEIKKETLENLTKTNGVIAVERIQGSRF